MALDLCKKNGFRVIPFKYIALLDLYFMHRYIYNHKTQASLSIKDPIHRLLSELWPLTLVRILFLLNILRMNGWNLIRLCIQFDIDKI